MSNKEPIEELLKQRAKEIKKRIKPFSIVRYHNDADGIVGAIYLSKLIRAYFIPKWNVHYTIKEAIRDIQECSGKECGIILLDLGSSKESLEAIELVRNAGIDIIVIDHHPAEQEIKDISLNPMFFSEEGGKYSAGYLAYLLVGEIEYKDLWKIALAGDKSDLGYSEEQRIKALVFDYLAYYDARLKMFEKVLRDKKLYMSIELTVLQKIEEIEREAKKYLKTKDKIYILNLDKVVKEGFPNKGKALGIICSMLKEYTIIGYGEGIIMVRTTKDIQLENELKDIIELYSKNYGGHKKAIAIRVEKGKEKEAIESIANKLNQIL